MSMANVDENKILERRLNALSIVYEMVLGKQVSERFKNSITEANVPLTEKIQVINGLIDNINQINGLKKYLHSLLD
jgi:hypothetical protein